jgi:hypothetical protein
MARISSSYYLIQGDYPDISIGSYTIANAGCGVCCLAMYLLNKSSISSVTDDIKREAINAIIDAGFLTGASLYSPPQSKSVSFNSSTYTVAFSKTSDVAAGVQNGGIGFVRIYNSSPSLSHFVLVDGVDLNSQASTSDPDNLKKHLVVDPSDGTSKTLYQAIIDSFENNNIPITTPRATNLDTNWKCLFN